MAGRPEAKRRREREAAAAARRPVDPALKREALQLAEEHGPAEAAKRTGLRAATIRTWRARDAARARPRASTSSSAPSATPPTDDDAAPPTTRAQTLRARAEKAREAQWRAEDRADKQIGKGQSAESRNAMVSANSFAERAAALDADADAAELHEVALSQTQGRLVLELLGAVFDDVALPRPDALLRARLAGWPADPDASVVEEARELLRRPIAAEERARVLGEVRAARAARRALPGGEAEQDAEGEDDEDVDAEAGEEGGDPAPVDDEAGGERRPERARDRRARERGEDPARPRLTPTREPRFSRGMFEHPGGG